MTTKTFTIGGRSQPLAGLAGLCAALVRNYRAKWPGNNSLPLAVTQTNPELLICFRLLAVAKLPSLKPSVAFSRHQRLFAGPMITSVGLPCVLFAEVALNGFPHFTFSLEQSLLGCADVVCMVSPAILSRRCSRKAGSLWFCLSVLKTHVCLFPRRRYTRQSVRPAGKL
jgi:hypothetical protein